MQKGININTLYKKMNKKGNYKVKYLKLTPRAGGNVAGPGAFRYKLANEHWIIYHPEEIIKQARQGKGEYLKNRLSN